MIADEGYGFLTAEELLRRNFAQFRPQTASSQIETELASAKCMKVSLASSKDGDTVGSHSRGGVTRILIPRGFCGGKLAACYRRVCLLTAIH